MNSGNREEGKVLKDFILSPTILIGVSTLFAYIYSYIYQIGYFSYFGIPEETMQFDILSLLSQAGAISYFLMTGLLIFVVLYTLFIVYPLDSLTQKIVYVICFTGLLTILVFFHTMITFELNKHLDSTNWLILILSPLIPITLIGIFFIMPIVRYKYIKGIKNRFEYASLDRTMSKQNRAFINMFIVYTIIMIFFGCFMMAGDFGQYSAYGRTEYYVMLSEPEYVVLFMDNLNVVCARYGKYSKIVDNTFYIYERSDLEPIILEMRKIGPLTPGDLFD